MSQFDALMDRTDYYAGNFGPPQVQRSVFCGIELASSQTNAPPEVNGPGGGGREAGRLPCRCQVRNNEVSFG